MVQQAFQHQSRNTVSYFEQNELSSVLGVWANRVSANEWRDYSIICAKRATTFVVLDNGRDIASLSKYKDGLFNVRCESYSITTNDFNQALENFKTDFGNKKQNPPVLSVISSLNSAFVLSLFLLYKISMKFLILTLVMVVGGLPVFASEIPAEELNQKNIIKAAMVSKPHYKKTTHPSKKPKSEKKEEPEVVEEIFIDKPKINYIGDIETIRAEFEDTLLQIGRDHNLGYVEMVAANPNVDPILPGQGTKIILPKRHLIPDVPQHGLVINLAEMRMYDFATDPENPKTYPLGIGRDGLNTPLGQTKITRKKEGPSWRPTPRMRKENPELPAVVEPGPDNPLGTHALYLGWPAYLIHGTHKPLGVGRRVSSGCIRMYPEDIIKVFENIPVGTSVNVIKQPIKLAWINDMLFLEAHAEDELADAFEDIGSIKEYRVPETLFSDLSDVAGDSKDRLDWKKIREAVKYRRGIPIAILLDAPIEEDITEDVLMEEPIEEKPKRAPRMQLN